MQTKLTFRPLSQADTLPLINIYSDKEAMKYRASKPILTVGDAQAYIRDQRLQQETVLTIREGVELVAGQDLIGSVMYRYDREKPGVCEIGYSIGRQFWGQGYGHDILELMLEALQEREDVTYIIAECHKENIASIRVLAKAGFEHIGHGDHADISIYRKQNHLA